MSPAAEVNEALIREVLAFIQLHPERWDQRHYLKIEECGTVGCFAGWAAVLGVGLTVGEVDETGVGALNNRRQLAINRLLGLSDGQFVELYGFTTVFETHDDGEVTERRPTFAELCEKVEQVTGIEFKPEVEL